MSDSLLCESANSKEIPANRLAAQVLVQDREEVLLADCRLDSIEETRQHWPFLRDRRVDRYAGLLRLADDDDAPG